MQKVEGSNPFSRFPVPGSTEPHMACWATEFSGGWASSGGLFVEPAPSLLQLRALPPFSSIRSRSIRRSSSEKSNSAGCLNEISRRLEVDDVTANRLWEGLSDVSSHGKPGLVCLPRR